MQAADFIAALEDNSIAEIGTHDELIAADGVYARIHQTQLLSEKRGLEVDSEAIEDGKEELE